MASVTFQGVLLSLVSDETDVIWLPFATQVNPSDQTPGEDRMYGDGRYNGLTAGATQRQHAVASEAVPQADAMKLRSWSGRQIWYRDDWGEKYVGSFRSPQVTRHPYNTECAVSFTVTEQTYSDVL